MPRPYECARCRAEFLVEVSEIELDTVLDADRVDACPGCGQRVGTGPVTCRRCAATFDARLPHWHVQCNLCDTPCPACGERYLSLCVC